MTTDSDASKVGEGESIMLNDPSWLFTRLKYIEALPTPQPNQSELVQLARQCLTSGGTPQDQNRFYYLISLEKALCDAEMHQDQERLATLHQAQLDRRKYVLGEAMLKAISLHPPLQDMCARILDEVLTAPDDRNLFGLQPLADLSSTNHSVEEPELVR